MTADDRSRRSGRKAAAPRSAEDRIADHTEIERLAEDLVPALIAKLSASGLGEIEIGEDDWTVRLRRPGGTPGQNRRATDRASRAQPGHAGHGHAPGSFEGHRSTRDAARPAPSTAGASSSNGAGPEDSSSGGRRSAETAPSDAHRAIATSPAVGVFHPKADLNPGTRVRSGDRLGTVDMLGIPQEVIAPADGILGASLIEAGQAVEYGQELIIIELAGRPTDRGEG